jgi:hypothetical protein
VEVIEFNKRFHRHGQTTLTMPTLCVMCLLKAFMDTQDSNDGTTWKKPRKGKEPMVDEEKQLCSCVARSCHKKQEKKSSFLGEDYYALQ